MFACPPAAEGSQDKAVPEYWIIDVEARQVERWPNDLVPEILTETLEWFPDALTAPLTIALTAYFDRALGLVV